MFDLFFSFPHICICCFVLGAAVVVCTCMLCVMCCVCCVSGHTFAGYAACLLSSYMYGLSPTRGVIRVGELERITRSIASSSDGMETNH